jgi:hypothetical protein
MKLPADAFIAREKLTRYLLVPQERGDKSRFLEMAGYTQENVDMLERDLRALLALHAQPLQKNAFGQYYELRGRLSGPNGTTLNVKTIWIQDELSAAVKFVTLIPDTR